MRSITLTFAFALAFTFVASAAPAPAPIPQETLEQTKCLDECLSLEEDCLLNSISMSGCIVSYDECHRDCIPEPDLGSDDRRGQEWTEEGEERDDEFEEIPAPKGGEDDEEFDDDPSDY